MSLVSFPVFFQCKRYRGSVGASAVRDFRGAMAGRGDEGLLITTGTFTGEAKAEATRDGAPPIDLIDGLRLCDLLKEYGLGVSTVNRVVEDVSIEKAFFADLRERNSPKPPRPQRRAARSWYGMAPAGANACHDLAGAQNVDAGFRHPSGQVGRRCSTSTRPRGRRWDRRQSSKSKLAHP